MDDGSAGHRLRYTIGTGGSSVMALLRDHLAPRLARPRSVVDRGHLARPAVRDPRHQRRRDHQSGAGSDRHRAVGLALPARRPAVVARRRRRASSASPSTPPRAAGCTSPDDLVRERWPRQQAGFKGAKIKVGKPHLSEDVARLRAVREAVGDAFEIMVDANQCFTLERGAAPRAALRGARHRVVRGAAAGRRHRGPCAARGRQRALPIAVGESLYSPASSRPTCSRAPARSCRSTWHASAASRRG